MRRNDKNEATEVVLYWLGAAEDNRAWLYQLMAETQPEDLADRLREETRGAIWYGTGGETGFRPPVDDWASVDWEQVAEMCKAGAIAWPEAALGGYPGTFPIIALRKLLAPALSDCPSPDQLAEELRTRAARVKGSERNSGIDWSRVARNILETNEEMITTVARERLTVAFDALRDVEAAYEAQHDSDGPPNAQRDALVVLEIELREAAHALRVMHRMRGQPLDRLAAQVVTDAAAVTKHGHLRRQGMSTSDGSGDDSTRLALRAATHALELAEYVADIGGIET